MCYPAGLFFDYFSWVVRFSLQKAGISFKVDNRLPNLVNLNEDPQLSEMLLYMLKEGMEICLQCPYLEISEFVLPGLTLTCLDEEMIANRFIFASHSNREPQNGLSL